MIYLYRDTLVRMYDGSIKPCQNISIGDVLMGFDSLPRHVISTSCQYSYQHIMIQNENSDDPRDSCIVDTPPKQTIRVSITMNSINIDLWKDIHPYMYAYITSIINTREQYITIEHSAIYSFFSQRLAMTRVDKNKYYIYNDMFLYQQIPIEHIYSSSSNDMYLLLAGFIDAIGSVDEHRITFMCSELYKDIYEIIRQICIILGIQYSVRIEKHQLLFTKQQLKHNVFTRFITIDGYDIPSLIYKFPSTPTHTTTIPIRHSPFNKDSNVYGFGLAEQETGFVLENGIVVWGDSTAIQNID